MNFVLVLLLAAAPDFSIDAGTEGERLRFANYRCSSPASRVTDGGTKFFCPLHPGIDLTDALRTVELVVTGTVESIDAHGYATVEVSSVLKGQLKESSVRFPFTKPVGDEIVEGVWLLVRVRGHLEQAAAFGWLAPAAETYVRQLLAEAPCPARPSGACEANSVCTSRDQICQCEFACGVDDATRAPPPSWHCMPRECWSASSGASCSKSGLVCESTCGLNKWECRTGHWVFR